MKLFVTIALIGILTSGSGFAHDFTQGSIYLDHPMIEEAPPNAPVRATLIPGTRASTSVANTAWRASISWRWWMWQGMSNPKRCAGAARAIQISAP